MCHGTPVETKNGSESQRSDDIPVAGVRAMDHVADLALEVVAPDLPELLRRAALGTAWLLLERASGPVVEERQVSVRATDAAPLLRELLRELLWWHDREGLDVVDLSDVRVSETGDGQLLEARAQLARGGPPPVREIKGVTLHGLEARKQGEGWYGRVIFDV